MYLYQGFGSGGSAGVVTTAQSLTLTSSWQRFDFTFTLASLSGKTVGAGSNIELDIVQPNADTGTAAWTLDFTGVQLEVGDTATDFEHRSYGDELARCQRYFERQTDIQGIGVSSSAVSCFGSGVRFSFKRTTPTIRIENSGGTANYITWNTAGVSGESVASGVSNTTILATRPFTSSTTSARNSFSIYLMDVDAEL